MTRLRRSPCTPRRQREGPTTKEHFANRGARTLPGGYRGPPTSPGSEREQASTRPPTRRREAPAIRPRGIPRAARWSSSAEGDAPRPSTPGISRYGARAMTLPIEALRAGFTAATERRVPCAHAGGGDGGAAPGRAGKAPRRFSAPVTWLNAGSQAWCHAQQDDSPGALVSAG
jgi:hypothetical protein